MGWSSDVLFRSIVIVFFYFFFFFNDTATTEIYTLSLHDALPISGRLPPIAPTAGVKYKKYPKRKSRPGYTEGLSLL